ncbi:uncharacterized protein I303_103495 [Kwoniella dejecticola CBS 10117]|uniref:Translation initiation factor 4E n=1 Tax=Kwoniella dejecticola CBS 10117 TaxID=1296121 RepID=A0A1A6A6X0_9TREE|nr:uncharacterized protein I303_03518 [Kwoniella dejecticola CBS 10117]OBR85805.1 hypothetical protein I303_03518 [Kwoniella dejecticola CBS 10117]
MSTLLSSEDQTQNGLFLNSAFRNLSNDPVKLQQLILSVKNHAWAEKFPQWHSGNWILHNYDNLGTPGLDIPSYQIVRIDPDGSTNTPGTGAAGAGRTRSEGVRGRLKGVYRKTQKPVASIRLIEDDNEKGKDEEEKIGFGNQKRGFRVDDDEEVSAYIAELDKAELAAEKRRKKNKSKKKRSKRKLSSSEGDPRVAEEGVLEEDKSMNSTVQVTGDSEGEGEEANVEVVLEDMVKISPITDEESQTQIGHDSPQQASVDENPNSEELVEAILDVNSNESQSTEVDEHRPQTAGEEEQSLVTTDEASDSESTEKSHISSVATPNSERVLSPVTQPAVTPIRAINNQGTQEADNSIESSSPSFISITSAEIVVKLPTTKPITDPLDETPAATPVYNEQFPNNIIFFGTVPTEYFQSFDHHRVHRSSDPEVPTSLEESQEAETETFTSEEAADETKHEEEHQSASHTRKSSAVEEEIVTPIVSSHPEIGSTTGPSPDFFDQQRHHKLPMMFSQTPSQSPPSPNENALSTFLGSITESKQTVFAYPATERPLTPPPELEDDEDDGTLVFPVEPAKIPHLPKPVQPILPPSMVVPPAMPSPVPSITLNTPTIPYFSSSIYPLNNSWTLYYSNTSHQRKVSAPIPVPALGFHPNAVDYSSHLFTIFSANNLEDLFGSWKALRRSIARSKGRNIEPLGDSMMKGGPGLGTHFFPDETNFHFFKSGIKPMWEDKMCQKGGKIMIAGEAVVIDNLFLEFVLLLISGEIDETIPPPAGSSSTICGVVLSRRKLTRLELWLGGKTSPDREWVGKVTRFIEERFRGSKVYGFKSFGKN